jgi:hypothetical protein
MMSTWARRRVRRYAELVFVGSVTALLLALLAELAGNGVQALPSQLVYSFAVGFGLEYVRASWREIVPHRC